MATAQGLEDELKTKNMYTCQDGSGQVRLVCQLFKTECRSDPVPELKFFNRPSPKQTGFGWFRLASQVNGYFEHPHIYSHTPKYVYACVCVCVWRTHLKL